MPFLSFMSKDMNDSDGKASLNGRNRQKLQRAHRMWVRFIDFT